MNASAPFIFSEQFSVSPIQNRDQCTAPQNPPYECALRRIHTMGCRSMIHKRSTGFRIFKRRDRWIFCDHTKI